MSLTAGPVENMARGWKRRPSAELSGVKEPLRPVSSLSAKSPGTSPCWR